MKLPALAKSQINRLGLAYFVLAVGLTSLIFVSVQQSLRLGANDPQIQLAHDSLVGAINGPVIDVSSSLASFEIIFDEQHNVLAATGQLDGKTPTPPAVVFEYAKTHSDDRFTWEPKSGVRLATVVVHHDGGYVLAARNMREVEIREDRAQTYALATLALLIIIGLVLIVVIK